jgi:isopentenyl phosphate kinase
MMSGMNVTLLKLGGSLLTDKEREATARAEVIERLAGEIARARAARPDLRLVLGHGSGSFGHAAAKRHGLAGGRETPPARGDLRAGIVATRTQATHLHRLMMEALSTAGAFPWSISPSSCLVSDDGAVSDRATFPVAPLAAALDLGLLPVTYGDVVMDSSRRAAIVSTETVLGAVAAGLAREGWTVERALWAGTTAGVWDLDGEPIPLVHPDDSERARVAAGAARGADVTGGMEHRLGSTLELARSGVPSLIFDGTVPGAVERALLGGEVAGTRVE